MNKLYQLYLFFVLVRENRTDTTSLTQTIQELLKKTDTEALQHLRFSLQAMEVLIIDELRNR